jgi:hypothetical protein
MDLQRVSLKILSNAPATLNLDPFLAIFGRWRADASHPAQWVDLADYAHMPRGPGIVLIGHRCNFSFDLGTAAPGILYLSKKDLTGTLPDRLRSVFCDAFTLALSLLQEKDFPENVQLRTGALELAFNDRLETPHADRTDEELRPAVVTVLDGLFGAGGYHLRPEPDRGRRYGFGIEVPSAPGLEVLLERLPA